VPHESGYLAVAGLSGDPVQRDPGHRGRRGAPVTQLYRIGIGKTYARTYVLALVQDLDIRIIDAATGEVLRDLTLDPTKIYQGTGRPPGPARK
jgi:hypothetical protein